jgi:purine-binding chemotaxis protein CheW
MAITSLHTRSSVGTPSADLQLVSFAVGGMDYGVDVADVYGIYHGLAIIPSPDAAPFLDGEVQLAGRRIPIVNLRRFAGMLGDVSNRAPQWIVMVSHPGGPVGLVVDKVSEVLKIPPQNLRPLEDSCSCPVSDYIVAQAHHQGRSVYLPDFSRLLHDAVQ